MIPTPDDLFALARKYRTLAELRRAKENGASPPEASVFRDLAAEFPGALQELDTLPRETIDARASALEAAAARPSGAAIETWMSWLHAYHAMLRAALYLKRNAARFAEHTSTKQSDILAEASRRAGVAIGPSLMAKVTRPPGGRIVPVVFQELSEMFDVPAETIWDEVLPQRRARRQPRRG